MYIFNKNKMIAASVVLPNDYCKKHNIPESCTLEELSKLAKWGTYGIKGDKPLKYKYLHKCSSSHLLTILATQFLMPTCLKLVVAFILNQRINKRRK